MKMTTQKIRTIINDMIAETNTLINTYDNLIIIRYWIRYKYELQKSIEMLDEFTDDNVDTGGDGDFEWAIRDRRHALDLEYIHVMAGAFPYPHETRHMVEIEYSIHALDDLLFRIDVNRHICDIG